MNEEKRKAVIEYPELAKPDSELLACLKWAMERLAFLGEKDENGHAHCANDCMFKRSYAAISKAEGRKLAGGAV